MRPTFYSTIQAFPSTIPVFIQRSPVGLDYSKGCANFRDVGECLNLIAGRAVFPPRQILRGGKLNFVESADEIGFPGTVLNLRRGTDPLDKRFDADHWHVAIGDDHEKYDTTIPAVRRWLNEVLACLAHRVQRLPVLLHCTSGKDRTGIVVGAILTALRLNRELVVQEYLWSEGDVKREWIEQALDGIGDPEKYFRRETLPVLRQRFGVI